MTCLLTLALVLNGVLANLAFALPIQSDSITTDQRVQSILEAAIPRLTCNLSAVRRRKSDVLQAGKNGLKAGEIAPALGSILAADSKVEPDYYFHWTRDSALTVAALVELLQAQPGAENSEYLHGFLNDYIEFSAKVQTNGSHYGVADPRANIDGSVDFIQWSRPQGDGPALQSLSLLLYLNLFREKLSKPRKKTLLGVVERDLTYISNSVEEKSYDPWEENFGYHFYTRLVQLSALKESERVLGRKTESAAKRLEKRLEEHWDEKRKIIKASTGELISWKGLKAEPPGGGLDSISLLAVLHARHPIGTYLPESGRVLSTTHQLELLFRRLYPINQGTHTGAAMGRYEGDRYYGGNPWFITTLAAAEFYARLAEKIAQDHDQKLILTQPTQKLFEAVLKVKLKPGQNFLAAPLSRQRLRDALVEKSEAFFTIALNAIPPNAMVAEQFDMKTGTPLSGHDLSWSYAALITASLARDRIYGARPTRIDWNRIHFRCAK
jgi:glucoamylase